MNVRYSAIVPGTMIRDSAGLYIILSRPDYRDRVYVAVIGRSSTLIYLLSVDCCIIDTLVYEAVDECQT